jgi:hypothetical protein
VLQHLAERGVERDVRAHLRVAHAGVGGEFGAGEARELALAGGLYPLSYDSGALSRLVILQLSNRERGRLDVDVNAVQQRAADARPVSDNRILHAPTLVFWVSPISTGTGLRCLTVS